MGVGTQETNEALQRLRQLLAYDVETGVFRWAKPPRRGVSRGSVAGYVNKKGYVYIGVHGHLFLAHRVAWAFHYGAWPATLIDHRDHDPTNNRVTNLRLATSSLNGANSRSQRPYKGAFRIEKTGRWMARIVVHRKQKYLGVYASAHEAHEAYCAAAKEYFGAYFFRRVALTSFSPVALV